jgi:predicted Zn-dependent protease
MNALLLAAALFAAPGASSRLPARDSAAAAREHFLNARELELRGLAPEALAEYRAAFRLDPKSRDLCFLLLDRLKDASLDSAEALAARCLALKGKPAAAEYKAAGEIALRSDDAAAAHGYYTEARRLAPDDGDVLYVLAGLSEESGDWATFASVLRDLMPRLDYPPSLMDRLMRAYGRLDSAAALEPVLREAWTKTGRESYGQALAAWLDLRDRPLSFLRVAKELAAKHPSPQHRELLARAYARADRPDSALSACEALLKERPGDLDLRYFKASLLFDAGRYKEARAVARELAKAGPEHPPFVFLAGASALELRKREALPLLEKALELAPLSPEYRARAAYADRVFGRSERDGARLAYAPTDSLSPEEALFLEGAAWSALAALLEPRESWRRPGVLSSASGAAAARRAALERYERVLAADTGNRAALFEVAVQAERLGDRERTKALLRRLVRRDSANALTLNYLGYVLVERPGASAEELEESGDLLRRAVDLEPENGAYLDSRGWWHYRRGELDSARAWLERSHEAMPRDVSVIDHLVEVLRAQGREAEACAWAGRIRALDRARFARGEPGVECAAKP